MELKVLSMEDCEKVREWRNSCLESLRTPFPLTEEQQKSFYNNVINDRRAKAKYWGIWIKGKIKDLYANTWPEREIEIDGEIFIGMCGLESIEWENGRAEISLIINPKHQNKGYGSQAIDILLDKGFNEIGLRQIWGEVYHSNPAKEFWQNIIEKYKGYQVKHKCIKFWNGEYWDSTYFSFDWRDYLNFKKEQEAKSCIK